MKAQVRLPILFVVLLSSISVFAVDVKTDYDHKIDFSQYKTYAWAKVETANPTLGRKSQGLSRKH